MRFGKNDYFSNLNADGKYDGPSFPSAKVRLLDYCQHGLVPNDQVTSSLIKM